MAGYGIFTDSKGNNSKCYVFRSFLWTFALQFGFMAAFDPNVFQAALLRVAEATEAAAAAAKAAAAPPPPPPTSSSSKGKTSVDCVKIDSVALRPFDYKTMDEDLKNFKDWLWQLTQYLITVDERATRQIFVP